MKDPADRSICAGAAGAGELPELHAADMKLIGEGGNSRVYDLDADKVVKVFHADIPSDMIYYEYSQSQEACAAGVPCAACYGMVIRALIRCVFRVSFICAGLLDSDPAYGVNWVRN